MNYSRDAAEEIRSGRPEAYYDYLEQTYGADLRLGTSDAIETFWILYRQISMIGNQHSTDLFSERFVPLLPHDARRELINEFLAKDRASGRKPGNDA